MRKKRKKITFQKNCKKTGYGNQTPESGNHRKSSFLGPRRTIQPPFQWLVLLYPSIYLSIYWRSLGRPNHCLSFQILSKSFKSHKNLRKIPLKSIQTLSKSSQDRPRTVPEPSFKTERVGKIIFSCFFFFQFFEGPGPPKIQAKSLKIAKKR